MDTAASPATDATKSADAAAPSADELIAQLATDDLDRLLSAADVDRAPPPSPIDGVAQSADSTAPSKATTAADPQVESVLAAGVDDMADLESLPSHPEAAAPASAQAAGALDASAPNEQPQELKKIADLATSDEPIPAYLLPLEWLNWPFRQIPEPIITVLGYAAILTLINAAAILLYVHRFRHK